MKMKKMRVLGLLTILLFVARSAFAQNYIIEPANGGNFGDLFHLIETNDANEPYQGGGYATNIRKGQKVTIEPEDKGFIDGYFVIITTEGKKYLISAENLKFGENPEGTVDWVADYEEPEEGTSFWKIVLWVIGIGVALLVVYGLFSRGGSSSISYDRDWDDNRRSDSEDLYDRIERDNKRTEEANERRRQEEEWYRRHRKEEKDLF